MRRALVPTFAILLACGDAPSDSGEGGTEADTGSGSTASSTSAASTATTATSSPTDPDGSSTASSTDDDDSTDEGTTGALPTGGCFEPGEIPGSASPSGFAMPTLDDERATYERWGLTWSPDAEPSVPADPSFSVSDPDIHGATEGDDLWTSLIMFERTGEQGYLDRATAWRRYFVEDYRSCIGGDYASFCYDRDAYGADHLWGWGLLAWYESMGDTEALAEAEQLGGVLETLWAPNSPFGCLPTNGCVHYGLRQIGRHLLFASRLAELSDDPRWPVLRETIILRLLAAPEWDAERGMYFIGEWGTDEYLGMGAWMNGARIQSPFMIGVLGEGMDHAYRTTGNEELRARMVAMAGFVDEYGLDPDFQYSASMFGIVDGENWHSYAAQEPVEFWDPVYTTALVNTLVRGWRYSCDGAFYQRARYFFERGNRGMYGEPVETAAPEGTLHHFVDTRFDTSTGSFSFDYNKGELQYTYLLFDPEAPPES